MAKIQLSKVQEWIDSAKNGEDELDLTKLTETINTTVDGITDKNKPDTDKLHSEGVANFLKENGFDDMASYKAFVKNGATADSERVNEIKLELEKANGRITELNGIETDYKTMKNRNLIRTKGISDNEKIEFMEYKINKNVKEDVTFEDAFNSYVEANPTQFETTAPKPHYVSTGRTNTSNNNVIGKSNVEKLVEERTGVKLN